MTRKRRIIGLTIAAVALAAAGVYAWAYVFTPCCAPPLGIEQKADRAMP